MKKSMKTLSIVATACLLAGVLIYSGCKKNELLLDQNSGNSIGLAQLSEGELIDALTQKPPLSSEALEQILLDNAPLSNQVLLAILDRKPPVSAEVIQSVFIASSPFSNQVFLALLDRNPSLSEDVIQQISFANFPYAEQIIQAIENRNPPIDLSLDVNDFADFLANRLNQEIGVVTQSVVNLETITCDVTDATGTGTGVSATIDVREQIRIYEAIRNEAVTTADDFCAGVGGSGTVLAFVASDITFVPGPEGGIIPLIVGCQVLVGCQAPINAAACNFSTSRDWAPLPLGPANQINEVQLPNPNISGLGFAVGDIEQILNDASCNLANLPPPNCPVGPPPVFVSRFNTPGIPCDAPSFGDPPSQSWIISETTIETPPYGQWTLSATELNQALSNALAFNPVHSCACQGPVAGHIVWYDVRAVFDFTTTFCCNINTTCGVRRRLFVTTYHRCCGICA